MKAYLIIFCLLFVSFSYTQVESTAAIPESSRLNPLEEIPNYNFDSLEHLIYTKSDKTYIIKFWGMWCDPCVRELSLCQE